MLLELSKGQEALMIMSNDTSELTSSFQKREKMWRKSDDLDASGIGTVQEGSEILVENPAVPYRAIFCETG